MIPVFFDANVFFSAVRSRIGGSYFVIELAKQKHLQVVTVSHALAEAERNIVQKIGDKALQCHYDNLMAIQPQIQSLASVPLVLEYHLSACMAEKDIPIVLGALLSKTSIILTLDQRHLLRNIKLMALHPSLSIMTPGAFLEMYFK